MTPGTTGLAARLALTPVRRERIARIIEALLALLDEADGDPEREEGCDDDQDIVDEPHDSEQDDDGTGESPGTWHGDAGHLTAADQALVVVAKRLATTALAGSYPVRTEPGQCSGLLHSRYEALARDCAASAPRITKP
jgi:hypothetical protein